MDEKVIRVPKKQLVPFRLTGTEYEILKHFCSKEEISVQRLIYKCLQEFLIKNKNNF